MAPELPQCFRRFDRERFGGAALVMLFGVSYCVVSAGLIAYNKFLVHKDRFPYAVPLALLHTGFSSTLTGLVFLIRPSLFPSLTGANRVPVDAGLIFKGAVPIAFLFAGQLVLSNTAYLHSSVAFLQMMKEANLVLVYTMSLVVALEKFSWRTAGLLCCVIFATFLTIHGELYFSKTGFLLQGSSQLLESTKIVLQAMLLSSAGRKLDVLTYVLLVMPFCFAFLGIFLLGLIFIFPNPVLQTPQWSDLANWWPHLVLNACVAFCLNVVIALFVKHSSAVAFILAGICKDAMIVCAGAMVLKEYISDLQVFGFVLQLMLILLYTLMKTFPDKFEDGIFAGLGNLMCGLDDGSSRKDKDLGAAEAALKAAGSPGGRKHLPDYGAAEKGHGGSRHP